MYECLVFVMHVFHKFSRFRKYVSSIMSYHFHFLVINALTENNIWNGTQSVIETDDVQWRIFCNFTMNEEAVSIIKTKISLLKNDSCSLIYYQTSWKDNLKTRDNSFWSIMAESVKSGNSFVKVSWFVIGVNQGTYFFRETSEKLFF